MTFLQEIAKRYKNAANLLDQYDKGEKFADKRLEVPVFVVGDDYELPSPLWLPTLEDVMLLHSEVSDAPLIQDEERLMGTLTRPDFLVAYTKNPCLSQLGYSLAHGFVKSHYWADGNKRTAFMVLAAFLRMNCKPVWQGSNLAMYIIGLAEDSWSEKEAVMVLKYLLP